MAQDVVRTISYERKLMLSLLILLFIIKLEAMGQDRETRWLPWYRAGVVFHPDSSRLSVATSVSVRQNLTSNDWQFYVGTLGGTYLLKNKKVVLFSSYSQGNANRLGKVQMIRGAVYLRLREHFFRPILRFDTDFIRFTPRRDEDESAPDNLRFRLEYVVYKKLSKRVTLHAREEIFIRQQDE